jgi:hypothetical protein
MPQRPSVAVHAIPLILAAPCAVRRASRERVGDAGMAAGRAPRAAPDDRDFLARYTPAPALARLPLSEAVGFRGAVRAVLS